MLIVIYSSIVEKSPRVVSNASLSRQGMGAYARRLYWLQFRKMFRVPRGLNFVFKNYIALILNIALSL